MESRVPNRVVTRLTSTAFTAVCLLLLAVTQLHAQNNAQNQAEFSVPRVNTTPTIDGAVNPQEWQAATRVLLNIETSPGENIPSAITDRKSVV